MEKIFSLIEQPRTIAMVCVACAVIAAISCAVSNSTLHQRSMMIASASSVM